MRVRRRNGTWWYRGYAIRYWEGPTEWWAQIADAPEFLPCSAETAGRVRAMGKSTINELIAVGRLRSTSATWLPIVVSLAAREVA